MNRTMARWQPTRIEFSSGWWVDVDLLRHTMLTAESIAAYVHLDTATFIDELAVWAEGIGMPYGIQGGLPSPDVHGNQTDMSGYWK